MTERAWRTMPGLAVVVRGGGGGGESAESSRSAGAFIIACRSRTLAAVGRADIVVIRRGGQLLRP